jgi:hypothetical protein
MERIRIGLGTDNIRFDGGRVSKTGAPFAGFPPRGACEGPSSYNRHRRLSISVSGILALPTGAPSKLSKSLIYPHYPQQPMGHLRIISREQLEGFR